MNSISGRLGNPANGMEQEFKAPNHSLQNHSRSLGFRLLPRHTSSSSVVSQGFEDDKGNSVPSNTLSIVNEVQQPNTMNNRHPSVHLGVPSIDLGMYRAQGFSQFQQNQLANLKEQFQYDNTQTSASHNSQLHPQQQQQQHTMPQSNNTQQQPSQHGNTQQTESEDVMLATIISNICMELNIDNQQQLQIAHSVGLRVYEVLSLKLGQLKSEVGALQHQLQDKDKVIAGLRKNSVQPFGRVNTKKESVTTSRSNNTSKPRKRKLNATTGKSSVNRWTPEQDAALRVAVEKHYGRNWKAISESVEGRDHVQCLQRWRKVLQPGLVKGHWTPEEDAMLLKLIQDKEMHSWAMVADMIKGRTAKQCRERWSLNLDPSINRTPWTAEEDALLLKLYDEIGGKWAEIKQQFQGRTENSVKTRYKSMMRAKAREWTQEQDEQLVQLRLKHGRDWTKIASLMPNRSRNSIKIRCRKLALTNETMRQLEANTKPPPKRNAKVKIELDKEKGAVKRRKIKINMPQPLGAGQVVSA